MPKARIPAPVRAEVMARFSCCAACGTWDADEVGHLVAESNGGTLDLNNLVRLCGNCNRVQHTAQVSFAAYAEYTIEPAVITSRRAYWFKYCGAARGTARIKAYRPPC